MKLGSYLLFIWMCVPAWAFSQGNILGRVVDEDGLPLPGATVHIAQLEKGTFTDVQGRFFLYGIPEGTYQVEASYLGYRSLTLEANATGSPSSLEFRLGSDAQIADEVLVIGDRLKGQAKALNQQRANANITNIVAADQIGRFPDANIGDAMKRIPGITMQYDQGEARDIIIRGLAPQLNAVMLNGERIPSAEGDNRRIQMDLIPADMVQTIEVNKAVLPDMDADAIGGSVNLVTRTTPGDLRVSGTLASGINMLTQKPIWTGSLVYGNRYFNDKLGVVVSGSYNDHDFGSDNIEAVWVETDAGVVIDELDIRKYLVRRVRRSINGTLDYRFNANHIVGFTAMYNWRDDWENRFRMRISQLEDAFEDGDFNEIAPGRYTALGRVSYQAKGGIDNDRVKARRLEDQRMFNYTLHGNHTFNRLTATWNVTYSRASEERPNERYIEYRRGGRMVDVDVSDPRKPFTYLTDRAENLSLPLNVISEQYGYTDDEDVNGRLDFLYAYGDQSVLKFGARVRTKQKERRNNFFEYEPLNGDLDNLGFTQFRDESDADFQPGSKYRIGNFPTPKFLGNLDLKNDALFDEADVPGEYVASNYNANENIYAGYLMANHAFNKKFSAIAGIRYEHTRIDYTGNIFDLDEEFVFSDSRSNDYGNFLPGVHLRYAWTPNSILRAAWTNTIARPNYFDLVPYAEFSPQDQELSRGNPDLKATTAMNLDIMAEHYFKSVGLISLGGFYKDLDQFIYRQTLQNYSDPQFGNDLEYSRPLNGGSASVYGLEASFQRQIWKGLGVFVNYTYTKSSTDGIEGREGEDLQLPGTAEHMFNASLSYETKKLVLRASLNLASDYIDELGGAPFEDRYYDKQTFLDVNASYAITPQWRVFMEGNNLTNQPLRYYQGISSRTMQEEFYRARFNFGVKFDLN